MINYLKTLTNKYSLLRLAFYPAIVTRGAFLRKKREVQEEIIENLQELLVEEPLIKMPEYHGNFFLDYRSDLFKRIIMSKSYEPKLAQCCKDLVDNKRDAIDIGANVGFFTVLFAKILCNRKVLSIEPTRHALSRLYKNIRLNEVSDKTIVFEGVVSNQIGETEIKTIEGKEEYSSIGAMKHPYIKNELFSIEKVISTTIDELINIYSIDPGFIKVDVEGAEHLVFEGARNTLSRNRPVILSELSDYLLRHNGSSAINVVNLIKEYDYDVVDPLNPDKPIRLDKLEKIGNILCLPK